VCHGVMMMTNDESKSLFVSGCHVAHGNVAPETIVKNNI
jgi:hypothetical protein